MQLSAFPNEESQAEEMLTRVQKRWPSANARTSTSTSPGSQCLACKPKGLARVNLVLVALFVYRMLENKNRLLFEPSVQAKQESKNAPAPDAVAHPFPLAPFERDPLLSATPTMRLGASIAPKRPVSEVGGGDVFPQLNLVGHNFSPSWGSSHARPGSGQCPLVVATSNRTSLLAPVTPTHSLAPGELPGYTGWFRPLAPLLNFYRPIHFGPRPTSPSGYTLPLGGLYFFDTTYTTTGSSASDSALNFIVDDNSKDPIPWTTVVLCPYETCQQAKSQFYARAYGPALLAGSINKISVENTASAETLQGYEIAFYFRFPGLYTVEVVLEQGDAWGLEGYPRTMKDIKGGDPDPAYEGWMLPDFPRSLVVERQRAAAPKQDLPWCSMQQIATIDRSAQWIVTGKAVAANPIPDFHMGSKDQYQTGFVTLGICTDYVKRDCALLPTNKIIAANPGPVKASDNILSRCMDFNRTRARADTQRVPGATNKKSLNIIIIGDSVVRYNMMRLADDLKLSVTPGQEVYVTFIAQIFAGAAYIGPVIQEKLESLAKSRDEYRVVIFNFGLHDIKDGCVSTTVDAMNTKSRETPVRRAAGDCLEFFRFGFSKFVEFLERYPADLKVFRTSNAGWMRWGNFGFGWPAENQQLSIYSHHSTKVLNEAALEILHTTSSSIYSLDFYWPTLARPDNTDVDGTKGHSAASHLVHPGVDTSRLLVRMQVMMIMRHFCSDYLDSVL